MKNAGLWADRLNQHNSREVAFAEQWEQENERINESGAIVCSLLYTNGHGGGHWCTEKCPRPRLDTEHLDRDRVVASTIVQWLGSNVGFSFLEEALKRCGYRIVKAEVK